MNISLKDLLLKASSIPETESQQIIVARFQSLVCHDVFTGALGSIDGVLVIPGGELTNFYRSKAVEAKLIVASQYSYTKENYSYPQLRDWARENNVSLIYVEYCSELTDEDFEGAEILDCYPERGLTVGDLISQIEAKNAPDCIAVYQSDNGLYFVDNHVSGGPGKSPARVKSARLNSELYEAITVKQYLEFLRSLNPEGAIDIPARQAIPTNVEYFGKNVLSVNVATLSNLKEYYTRLIRHRHDS